MRVLRSSLFVAVTALVAAACGDKVNVTPPAVIPPTLHGIVVAPSTATISVLQTVQLTAAVSADAGVTPTVTWTTTNSGVAGVTQTGLVNGVAAGTAGICAAASATGLTTVSNCASVIVQPPTTVVPAILQIASVTIAGNLNAPVPVPPAATAGQINVSVTVNPGTERMDSVQVNLINAAGVSIPGATQIFTSAQAAVMRSAANDLSAQALITSLVFSINTAAFNPTTGAVTFLNGPYTVTAVGYGHQGTSAMVNSSTNNWPLIFGNMDGWILTQTLGVSTPGAFTNVLGYNYVGGPTTSLTVSAIPVLYSGAAISTSTALLPVVTFGSTLCGNTVARTQPMTAPVAPSHAFTAVFTRTALAAAGPTNVNNYEFASNPLTAANLAFCTAANNAGGETSVITGSWYTNSTLGPIAAFGIGQTPPILAAANIRLDNQAPVGMVLTNTPNGRTSGWFNDAVVLNGTTANGIISTPAIDAGAGGIVYTATVGGVAMTSTSTLAETSGPSAYTVSVIANDALNNATAASTKTFGVDRTPPTLTAINGPKAPGNLFPAIGSQNAAFTTDPLTGFAFVANDPTGAGGVTGSGFFNLAATPITMSESARNSTGTKWWCPATTSYVTVATGCVSWVSGTSFLTNMVSADNGIGNNYFLTTASITDQAGNSSSPSAVQTIPGTGPFTTNLFAVDGSAVMALGNLDPPSTFPTSNTSYPFSFGITVGAGGLDIALARLNFSYSNFANDATTGVGFAGVSKFWAPDVVIDAWNAATLTTTTSATVTVNNMLTSFEITSGLGVNNAALNGNVPTSYDFGATNQPGNITMIGGWGLPASSYTVPAFPMTNGGGLNQGPAQWFICATAAAATACPTTPVLQTAGNITISRAAGGTAIITAVAAGTTGVFNNPFSQVQFWAYDPTTLIGWRLIGIANNSSNVTDGTLAAPTGRNWQFNMAFTANATNAPDNGVYRVIAIGIGASTLGAGPAVLGTGGGAGVALATPVGGITVTVAP
jgi:hypothetical protein